MTTQTSAVTRLESPSSDPDTLRQQITELSAHIYAATYRLLMLIGEMDRTGAWAEIGVASCAHWLNAFCGTGIVAAREKVRVARALPDLPLIREAFEAGRISYSKVRAMTRVATPENEGVLMSVAQYGTAAQVEKVARLYRGVKDLAEARRQHARRELTHYFDDDGSVVIRARLPAERGAMVLAALKRAMDIAFHERHDVSVETPTATDGNVPTDPRASEGAHTDEATRRCGTVDTEADVSAESYNVPIPFPDDCNAARRADALADVAESYLASGPKASHTADRYQVTLHVDRPALDNGAPPRCGLESGQELAAETARRLTCDCAVVPVKHEGETINIGRKSRVVPAGMRRALKIRDDGCRFPGCTRHRYVDAHHIQHWADGGETRLDNLVQLCRYHHRVVHEGGYTVVATDAGDFEFRNANGEPIHTDFCIDIDVDFERFLARMTALGVDAKTCVPTLYAGDRIDYDHTVWLLASRDKLDG